MKNDFSFDFRFMRPLKAEWTQKWYKSLQFRDDIGYNTYEKAVILPLKVFPGENLLFGRGGVNDIEGNYVQSSAIKDRVEGNYPLECSVPYCDDIAVYCGYLVNHWGHFLIEAINRIWFFIESDRPEYRYVFFVKDGEDRELKGNYREFFELLGILERIEIINRPTCFRNVIIPEISFNYLEYYSRQYQIIFEKVIKTALSSTVESEKKTKRVYLSRSAFTKACRTEFGLDLLDHFFQKNGYEIVFPEQYTLTELIQLMHRAEVIAAESGSTSHNMLFCDYGQQFVVVERQTIVNRVQTSIDCVKLPQITYIDADMMIYPVVMGRGPFLMLYNSWFKRFTEDRGYLAPEDVYVGEKYIQKNLRNYLRAYRDQYYLGCGFEDNQITFISLLLEGYWDSMDLLGKYLKGQVPFCKEQLFYGKYSHFMRVKKWLVRTARKLKGSIRSVYTVPKRDIDR